MCGSNTEFSVNSIIIWVLGLDNLLKGIVKLRLTGVENRLSNKYPPGVVLDSFFILKGRLMQLEDKVFSIVIYKLLPSYTTISRALQICKTGLVLSIVQ